MMINTTSSNGNGRTSRGNNHNNNSGGGGGIGSSNSSSCSSCTATTQQQSTVHHINGHTTPNNHQSTNLNLQLNNTNINSHICSGNTSGNSGNSGSSSSNRGGTNNGNQNHYNINNNHNNHNVDEMMSELKYMKGYVNVLKERFTRKSLDNTDGGVIVGLQTSASTTNATATGSGKLSNDFSRRRSVSPFIQYGNDLSTIFFEKQK